MTMHSSFRPKKNLSQNFLIDPNIAQKIVESMNIQPDDRIVEIGPGQGALTKYLIQSTAYSVTAIELDERLINHLESQFNTCNKLRLIHQDFLKLKFSTLISENRKMRIVGNLPYGITSPILFHICQQ